jgi:hypothetical protein
MWYVTGNLKWVLGILASLAMSFPTSAFGETVNTQNLTLSEPCIGCEVGFTVSQSTGPAGTGGGLATNTYAGLMKWTLDNTVTGRLAPFANATRFGLAFDNTQLFQSFLTPRFFTVVSANTTTCPSASANYNYILVRFRPPTDLRFPMDAQSSTFFSGGSITYNHTEEAIQSSSAFSLASATPRSVDVWYEGLNGEGPGGSVGSVADNCASGSHLLRSYSTDSPWDSYSTVFFGAEGLVTIGLGGNPAVAVGSPVVTLDSTRMNQLASTVQSGFVNVYLGTPLRTDMIQKNIFVYPNGTGTLFDLKEMNSVDDPWDYSNYGSLSCPIGNRNSPMNGFVRCTLSIEGVAGFGNAVCMISKRGFRDLIACNAQYPDNKSAAVSILALTHDRAKLAVSIPSGTAILPSPQTTTFMANVSNVTGVPIANLAIPSSVPLQLPAPYSLVNPFAGTNGTCLSYLGPYQSCTVEVQVSPGLPGTYAETLRVQYSTGQGTENGTSPVVTVVGLSSIAVTPSGPFVAGDTQQFTATATYSDASTQNVTAAVNWSSSNSSVISINSAGLATFLAASAGATTITAGLAGQTGTRSPTVTANPGPAAVLAANPVRNASGSTYDFTVTYTDSNAVNVSSLGNADVRVTGPSGFNQTATYMGVDVGVNGSPRVATYRITPPGGTWNPADDGTYTVSMEASQVSDALGNFSASGSIGTFDATPVVLIGQTSVSAGGSNPANGVSAAWHSHMHVSAGGVFFMSDSNRVLVWNSVPTSNGFAPNYVIGQADLNSNLANQGGTASANTLSGPSGIYTYGSKLIIADRLNSRVLIYNSMPTSNNVAADVVLGQPNMTSSSANAGGARAANTLDNPEGVWVDATGRLYVGDRCNFRVLIWNSIPTTNQTAANLVIGQANMTTAASGTSSTRFGTSGCGGVEILGGLHGDATRLYVVDGGSHRVLLYTPLPTTNDQAPSYAIGQPNLTGGLVNASFGAGNAQNYSLYDPRSVYSTGSALFVMDRQNNRVLRWNTIPTSNGAAASIAVGQPDLVSESVNRGGSTAANALAYPTDVTGDGTSLLALDSNNARILKFNALPTTNGPNANIVIGQTNMTNNGSYGFLPGPDTFGSSLYHYSDGTRLFLATSNRVLIWNTLPESSGALPNLVLGQTSFTEDLVNSGGLSASSLSNAASVFYDGTKLFVADYNNHRVLIWNTLPTTNKQAADVVIGQANMTSGSANRGGSVAGNGLNGPFGVFSDGTRMMIADYNNHRVLYYSTIPTTNGVAANFVLGQTALTCGTANKRSTGLCAATGISAGSLQNPTGVWGDGNGKWYVSDGGNHRVLVFNANPSANYTLANVILGQTTATANSANRGGSAALGTLSSPLLGNTFGGKLVIPDGANNRVLIWDTIPTTNGEAAARVVGQADGISVACNRGGGAGYNTLCYPRSATVNPSNRLWISDGTNQRLLGIKD